TSASGTFNTAVGYQASATGSTQASAFGYQAQANSSRTTSVGYSAIANTARATAVGDSAVATGYGSVALGNLALTSGAAQFSVAVGYQAQATQADALAIGKQAVADNARATAIGVGANTSLNDQVMLGGAGSSVAIGDIDASTAAQSGQLYAVTVDDSGTLGKGSALASAQTVASLGNSMRYIAAVSDAQFNALSSDVSALTSRVDALSFQLSDLDQSMRGGIAAAAALGSAIALPDKRFTIGGNIATHGGEQGY
ncbi:hypothetical protein, partial [Altererythrobacter sp. MF3-039]|uniref:hypothetical protein n=1 Tax=Altererythrobacter sp. MF3-039 TaxID=3252901 RepID=UPI00390C853F